MLLYSDRIMIQYIIWYCMYSKKLYDIILLYIRQWQIILYWVMFMYVCLYVSVHMSFNKSEWLHNQHIYKQRYIYIHIVYMYMYSDLRKNIHHTTSYVFIGAALLFSSLEKVRKEMVSNMVPKLLSPILFRSSDWFTAVGQVIQQAARRAIRCVHLWSKTVTWGCWVFDL